MIKEEAFKIFLEEYEKKKKRGERLSVAFSGGETPKEFFGLLASADIDWKMVDVFQADDRYLPNEDRESNFGNLNLLLLSKINIPSENIRNIRYLETLEKSRKDYEKQISSYLENGGRFDIIFLGMGKDGHTASLFSDNFNASGMVQSVKEAVGRKYDRITLSLSLINSFRRKIFLLKKDKREILSKVLDGGYPASYVAGDVIYLVENLPDANSGT